MGKSATKKSERHAKMQGYALDFCHHITHHIFQRGKIHSVNIAILFLFHDDPSLLTLSYGMTGLHIALMHFCPFGTMVTSACPVAIPSSDLVLFTSPLTKPCKLPATGRLVLMLCCTPQDTYGESHSVFNKVTMITNSMEKKMPFVPKTPIH